jgi:NAD-dependent dihydropyrimidine dehydrogenase PreA subunit
LSAEGKRIGFIFFHFGRGGFQLILWGILTVGIVAYGVTAGDFTAGFIFRWSFVCLVVVLLLSIDLMGSTPVYKSALHEDRLLHVVLKPDKCKGAGHCEEVCPRNCYELDKKWTYRNHAPDRTMCPMRCLYCSMPLRCLVF